MHVVMVRVLKEIVPTVRELRHFLMMRSTQVSLKMLNATVRELSLA